MNRRDLMTSMSALVLAALQPRDILNPFWRGVMFGHDEPDPPTQPFKGLEPRFGGLDIGSAGDNRSIWVVSWGKGRTAYTPNVYETAPRGLGKSEACRTVFEWNVVMRAGLPPWADSIRP